MVSPDNVTQTQNINMEEHGELGAEKADKSDFPDAGARQQELLAVVQCREKRLRELLGPLEGFIMSIQSLLVWEKPARSAVMLLCVNGLFWLAVTTHYRTVFLVAVVGIVCVTMETIYTKVWPEIRVHKPDEDEEGWTPVHPRLLSLPELCKHVVRLWVAVESLNTRIWDLRRNHPSKFCLYMSSLCLALAAIGHQFSGVLISYLIVTGLLLWPALEFHNVTGKLYRRLEPILQQLDHSIDSPRRELKRKATKRFRRCSDIATDAKVDSSDDSDLDEFCPSPGPSLDAALAHAATCGRPNRPSSGAQGGLVTDDEFTDTELPSYLGGLSQVPSYDNPAWDQSADELDIDLPYDEHPPVPGRPAGRARAPQSLRPPDEMPFDPGHFRDSADDSADEANLLAAAMAFPAVGAPAAASRRTAADATQSLLPPAAATLLSRSVTALMAEALAKIQDVGVTHPAGQAEQTDFPSPPSDPQSLDDTDLSAAASSRPRLVKTDSDSADFEVLDRAELEPSDEREAPQGKERSQPQTPGRSSSGYGIGYLTSWLSGKK